MSRWNDWGLDRWSDLGVGDPGRSFRALEALRRDMDRWLVDVDRQLGDTGQRKGSAEAWPRMSVFDDGKALTLRAELPGFADSDVHVSVDGSTITVSGERKVDVPEGYVVHRRERSDLKFSRAITVGTKVDAERTVAEMKHGVLRVTLPKAPEAQPKQITIKSG